MLEDKVELVSKTEATEMLRLMYETRAFEEQAEKSYMLGKIHGTMHLSIGQEGVGRWLHQHARIPMIISWAITGDMGSVSPRARTWT